MVREKRGQMNLSFGMIFSIILIIVFIAFAFYAIGKFLDIQKSAKTGQFIQALETDVEKMWRSSQGSQEVEYALPTSVDYVCFGDFSQGKTGKGTNQEFFRDLELVYFEVNNVFFYPVGSGGIDAGKVEHLDLIGMTSNENPYCATNVRGKVKLTLKKDINEALVTITR